MIRAERRKKRPVSSTPVRRKASQSTPDTAPSRMQKGLSRGRSRSSPASRPIAEKIRR